ncbi:hypothetical protein CGRA01v4_03622 [Colletotrichum graminicola]|nr:hypothetical protein CGRA01v4_03622 [Colletotrichum graminicola]
MRYLVTLPRKQASKNHHHQLSSVINGSGQTTCSGSHPNNQGCSQQKSQLTCNHLALVIALHSLVHQLRSSIPPFPPISPIQHTIGSTLLSILLLLVASSCSSSVVVPTYGLCHPRLVSSQLMQPCCAHIITTDTLPHNLGPDIGLPVTPGTIPGQQHVFYQQASIEQFKQH